MTDPPAKQFTIDQFRWLDQVATDLKLSPNAAGIAIRLVRYFNRTTREAWPAQETLAATLGLSERRVRSNLAAMVARGHLQLVGRKGGRGHSNHYRMRLKPLAGKEETRKPGRQRPPLSPEGENDPETRTPASGNPDVSVRKTGRQRPPNLLKNLYRTLDAQTNSAGELASAPDGALARPPPTDSGEGKQAKEEAVREAQRREWIALATTERAVRSNPSRRDYQPTIRKPPEGRDVNDALAGLGAAVRGEAASDQPEQPADPQQRKRA